MVVMQQAERCQQAMRRALAFLREKQLPSGEFKTVVAKDADLSVEARHDASPFATAHILSSLASCAQDECAPIIKRAAEFLRRQRLPGGLWKFWIHGHPGFRNIPADMDDTCVVSLALHDAKIGVRQNRSILLGNRDEGGCFFTWIQPRARHVNSPAAWLYWRLLAKSIVGRSEFFTVGEARPADVDSVVNANVACWLAESPEATREAVAWVLRVVDSGQEVESDRYYQSRYALYYAMARGLRRGVDFGRAVPLIASRIQEALRTDGSIGSGIQETALAAAALARFLGCSSVPGEMLDYLLARQRDDGSWSGEVFYYGGWSRDYCWGATELTTAFCVEALSLGAHLPAP